MKRLNLVGLFVLSAVCALASTNSEIAGKVVNVIDGNTVEIISIDLERMKIYFFGIDAPELDQEYGDRAKKLMEKITLNKNVVVQITGKDRLGQRIGIVLVEGNVDPRLEMLKQGLAWTAEKNAIPELESLKELARAKKRGLWRQDNPVPPWVFRRQQTMLMPKSS
ncbi:MAG: thermonuclease family protein [Cyclobacteriaceae bacterium]|jgi:micrococcal nuclease|nr:thermonuclease family protein [Flammeovirgaceae bacterium]